MIVKILDSASKDYNALRYNDKKIDKGTGELIEMKNFPSNIDFQSDTQDVRNYLISVSSASNATNPQFHATISSRFREHSREQLKAIGEEFMNRMGYGEQPYVLVFHNDTDNNHIHIVSTRIDKNTGKKINDSYERTKAQKAVKEALKALHISDTAMAREKELSDLLKYKYTSVNQFVLLLQQNGFKVNPIEGEQHTLNLFKNGVLHSQVKTPDLQFQAGEKDRRNQIKAILLKYREKVSNVTFKAVDSRDIKDWQDRKDPKITWESELKNKLREDFGLDIVFHSRGDQKPFGYTVIDHKAKTVWKGSELMKLQDLFQFTDTSIDRKDFELVNEYNITSDLEKALLMQLFKSRGIAIEPFMLFPKRRSLTGDQLKKVKSSTLTYLSRKGNTDTSHIHLLKSEDRGYFVVDTKQHYIGGLRKTIGEEAYRNFLHASSLSTSDNVKEKGNLILDMVGDITEIIVAANSGTQTYDEMDPKRKRRKKRRK